MAKDSTLYLRKAIVAQLRGDGAVTALVPAARIFTHVSPNAAKPFVRYGVPTRLPERASCQDGVRVQPTLHIFSAADSDDEAEAIAAALAASLDGPDGKGLVLDLEEAGCPWPAKARLYWTGGRMLADAEEASHWHGIVNLEAVVVS